MIKKTIQNVVLGGLSSLALVTGTSFADEPKNEDAPQGGILTEELKAEEASEEDSLKKKISSQLKEELKKVSMSDAQIEEVLKSTQNAPIVSGEKGKVIARTMVIGPDGKLQDMKNGGVDLSKLLSEAEDLDVKKLLSENKNAIVSGKVVIIDGDGNRIEKDLKEGGNLNEMLEGALDGAGLKFNLKVLDSDGEKIKGAKSLADKVDRLQEEMAAQRLLLEKILKKLE